MHQSYQYTTINSVLNSIKNKNAHMTENENSFVFHSVKYYYYLDKDDILNRINKNNFHSKISLLLKEKINEDLSKEKVSLVNEI